MEIDQPSQSDFSTARWTHFVAKLCENGNEAFKMDWFYVGQGHLPHDTSTTPPSRIDNLSVTKLAPLYLIVYRTAKSTIVHQ